MKKRRKQLAAMTFAAALMAGAISVTSMAREQNDSDTIDMSKTATLEIHKYDEAAAQIAGVDVERLNTADGETDTDAETIMEKYALEGVQFQYVKVGDIITDTDGTDRTSPASVGVVYSVEDDLMKLLDLSSKDAKKTYSDKADTQYCFSSTQINEALADQLERSYLETKNELEHYITSHHGTALADTDASGTTHASGLALGLYLIVETEVPEEVICTTDPFFVSLPMTDATGDYWIQDNSGNYKVTVYPKNQTDVPTINKVVRQVNDDARDGENYADVTSASEGDLLEYRIASRIPAVTTDASRFTAWTYEDTIAHGITYDQKAGVSIRFYDTEDKAIDKDCPSNIIWTFGKQVVTKNAYDEADTAARNVMMAYTEYTAGDHTMRVTLTPAGLNAINSDTDHDNSRYQGKYLTVCYSASVDSSEETILGDTGNPNDVSLTYKRTNGDYYETIRDKANVYTYGIDLTKTFSEALMDGHSASEVQFLLKNKTSGQFIIADIVTGLSGKKTAGQYHVADQAAAVNEEDATIFSPDDTGKLRISGLEADTYILTEVRTVDGFSLLKDDILIDIYSTEDSITPSAAARTGIDNPNAEVIFLNGERASATVNGETAEMTDGETSTHAYVTLDIANTKSFLLPKTGGIGTLIFSSIAACGGLIGFCLILSGRKKHHNL